MDRKSSTFPRALINRLGRIPDAELARRYGFRPVAVGRERRRRGIAKVLLERPWKKRELKLLGTDFDRVIARRLDRTLTTVAHKRMLLDIPAHVYSRRLDLTEKMRTLLGRHSDGYLARRWGCCTTTVENLRKQAGIPSYRSVHPEVRWTQAMLRKLGRQHDTVLARRWGISTTAVRKKRNRLGIPARHLTAARDDVGRPKSRKRGKGAPDGAWGEARQGRRHKGPRVRSKGARTKSRAQRRNVRSTR